MFVNVEINDIQTKVLIARGVIKGIAGQNKRCQQLPNLSDKDVCDQCRWNSNGARQEVRDSGKIGHERN
jgi:hypothetical protein